LRGAGIRGEGAGAWLLPTITRLPQWRESVPALHKP